MPIGLPQELDLVSGGVVHGSQAIAVALAVLAIVFWPGRGGWRRHWSMVLTLLARIGTLLVVLLATVVAVALSLNAWIGPPFHSISDIEQQFQTQPDPTINVPGVPVHSGGLAVYQVKGLLSHHIGRVDVWTPPGYNSRLHSKTYPVLFALHGYPGEPTFLETHLPLFSDIEQLAKQRKMAWPIVVLPDWGDNETIDTECTNGSTKQAGSQQIETWLAKDLPLWVRTHYRVKNGAENWATYGYSAGAYCSRLLTMQHGGTFGADIDLSGYSAPDFEASYQPFTASSTQGQYYNLIGKAELDPPNVALYLVTDPSDTSASEGDSYGSTQALRKVARKPLRLTNVETSGGHTVASWDPQTMAGLQWLARTLKGFRG